MSTPIEHHVSNPDAFTMQLERDPLLRSTVVAVARFDRVPDWSRLRERMDRATRLAPSFRERLVTAPWRLAPPRFVVDPDFDLDWHLQRARVPDGAGFEAVLDLARNAGMSAFDRDRPLWQFTLLEGLPDGGAALVMKVHHALTDGIGGIQLAGHVVDFQRERGPLGPMPEEPGARRRGVLDPWTDAVTYTARRVAGTARDLARAVPRALARGVRHPITTMSGTATTAESIARFVRPVTRTDSPVMTDRRLRWNYAVLDVPAEGLRAAGHRVDGSLNDAFLAAVTGGLRRYHERHHRSAQQLRVTMPVSIRGDHDPEGGNRITLMRFEVPVAVSDPLVRMRTIGARCRQARQEPAIPYTNAIAAVLNMLPISFTGSMLKHVDFLASNVPGFTGDVFVGGARLEALYPFGPTLGAALNVTLMSYRGTCNIGINTDAGAVPDPDVLRDCLREGFDEVVTLGA